MKKVLFLCNILIISSLHTMPQAGAPKAIPVTPKVNNIQQPINTSQTPSQQPKIPQSTQTPNQKQIATNPTQQITPEKKIINEIKKEIETVNTIKDSLKEQLQELDAKLHEARNTASQAKKASFSILQQEKQGDAQKIFKDIEQQLQKIKDIQSFVQGDFTQKFNKKIANFNTHTATLQSKIQTMKTLKPKTYAPTPIPTQQKSMKNTKQSNSSKSIFSDLITSTIRWFYKTKEWLINATPGGSQSKKKSTESIKKKKNINKQSLKQKVTTVTQQKNIVSKMQPVKKQINLLNQSIQQLDTTRIALSSRYQDVKKTQEKLLKELQDNSHLATLSNISKQKSEWKNTLLSIISKVLDFSILVVSKTVEIIKYSYKKYLQPTVKKFSQDVKDKLNEETTQNKTKE